MNKLPLEKRVQIVNLLVEGSSLRAITRITGCSINTVTKLLVDVGKACEKFHDEKVKNVTAKRVQCDETWSFVYAKKKNVPEEKLGQAGDVWTWVGIDSDTKLAISYFVGNRDFESANIFMQDLASRIKNRVQLTTDGLKAYLEAVEGAFGNDIDFGQLNKIYATLNREDSRRYSPAECTGAIKKQITGNPDPKHISTSHVERQNLTMRMSMRRFTRLTNGFSKKIENHCYAIALHFVYYNFCRIHKTLRVTPAMEAGLTNDIMEIADIVKLTDKISN
jgi:IS1 family transposase